MKIKAWVLFPSISIVLFALAFFSYPLFEKLVTYLLGDIPIMAVNVKTVFNLKLLFAITFAIIPLMTGLTNFLFQMKGKYTYFVYLSMFLSMIVFGGVRIYNIKENYSSERSGISEYIQLQYPMENLQIVTFMFVGCLIGCIVGALFLNKIQKKAKK